MDGWEGYDHATYGDRTAAFYDEAHTRADTPVTVERLAELAGDGPVLELGPGTGRIAIPLADRGLAVHGIDGSPAMVEALRAKPGGARVSVTVGDFGQVDAPGGPFSLIFVVFSTFFALPGIEAQRDCITRVAERLRPGGRFVMEAFVPDPSRFELDQRIEVTSVTMDDLRLIASRHDPAERRVESMMLWFGPWGQRMWPVRLQYAYPAELDEMAAAAGLRLEHRWADWDQPPFVPDDSSKHVSVYVRE